MFINSKELVERIQAVSDEIASKSSGIIAFEEYIALPFYGYIILRFRLNSGSYTAADLDQYEKMMCECAGNEFLIDFMGEVYRNVGIDYRQMDKLFADCLDFYREEPLHRSIYAQMLHKDGVYLLEQCGLPVNLPVWEIQLEEEIQLLLLGDKNEPLGQFSVDGRKVNVCQVASKSCEGLIAAAFYARRNQVSLANVLLHVQEMIERIHTNTGA